GLFWGISVLVEIVVFFFSTRLFKNWSISALFYLTGIAAIIRWLAFGYADTFVEIVLLQCFHSLTYVAGHYATVRYITTQPQNHIAKLQGLYNALAGCAAIAIFTALSGVLYPISPVYAFSLMAAFAFIGLFITPRGVKAFLPHRV
ncbi:MAG: MFS transporter, partial [Haemophilus parainfluenzae]|nr:MFS transporter [Haemophilus parainfluenzae]